MTRRKIAFLPTVFLILFSLIQAGAVYSDAPPQQSTPVRKAKTKLIHISKADSLIRFAKQFMGLPYIYASANPKKGFDCSGFVWYVFGHFGIAVPRSSIDYEKLGKEICIDSCRIGDIIVFTGTNAAIRHAGHVGIVISGPGENPRFIHSSSSKKHNGVVTSSFSDSPYYGKRFIKVVRVIR
jgi:lipoprotein Spr